jgi:hypothetical protein
VGDVRALANIPFAYPTWYQRVSLTKERGEEKEGEDEKRIKRAEEKGRRGEK